ncbi:MAG: UvrD-helicase domain-containing protein, partial [Phycisphaerae bacterium]|nr:UvrD-helicase domain-containing protein [Phycisphaerae bacterium]
DEYQDTNHAQYILAHGIAVDHDNICATGDPDQSIYAWRGADIRNILEFEADYPNATVIRLEENYRSTRPILEAAGRLISNNKMRKRKALYTRRAGGVNVRVICCDTAHAEAELIARRIAARRDGGGEFSDVAIFYRVNSLSRVLEEALLRASVPYRIARGVEFYNRKEIKDVLAYLKLLANPSDDLSCMRIINTPTRGIGATTLKRLGNFAAAGSSSILAACKQAEKANLRPTATKRVTAFGDLITSMAENIQDRPVREILEEAFIRSGLEKMLRQADEEDRSALANIEELITAAAEFDELSQGGALADYLQQVSLVSDVDHLDGAGGAVTLMTLHAAKG